MEVLLCIVFLVIFLILIASIVAPKDEASVWKKKYLDRCADRDDLNQKIGELQSHLTTFKNLAERATTSAEQWKSDFEKLQHQKISADVKLGGKAENLLPFLESFPYKDDEIRGLFNPIDLIVFRDEEVVFVEVKSGQSALSDKQRKIRDNIKAGRVRFETHRMDEKGIKIK